MIKRFELLEGALAPCERADAAVQLFVNPDAAEREALRCFGLDEHTLSSALDPDEVSRLESAPGQLLMIWKRPTNYSGRDTFYFNVASIGMLLREERLVVIVTDNLPLSAGAGRHGPVLKRPADVMLGLLLMTIQHYLEHLKVIKMIARDLQQKINTSMENRHLIQMFNLSESLVYYLNAINSNGVVLARLRTHAERAGFAAADIEFIDDLIIENNQCYKQAEIYSTVLSGLMDARGSLVNNNMSVLLKNLTLINVVFLPLNLIAGIGGMSEYSMMTRGVDWRIAYVMFFAAMGVLGWVTAMLLRRIDNSGGSPLGPWGRRGHPPGRNRHS